MASRDSPVVVVTGANSGIGLEYCRRVAREGICGNGAPTLVLACRNQSKAEAAKAELERINSKMTVLVRQVDTSCMASVHQFCQELLRELQRLDLLVCNAGVLPADGTRYGRLVYNLLFDPKMFFDAGQVHQVDSTTDEGFRYIFATNVLGHFLMVDLLSKLMIETAGRKSAQLPRVLWTTSCSARCLNVTEKSEDFQGENHDNPYGHSKYINILVARAFARILEPYGIKSVATCPGVVYTPMVKKQSRIVGVLTFFMPLLRWLRVKGMSWTKKNGIEALYFASRCPADSLRNDVVYQSNYGDCLVNEFSLGKSEAESDRLADFAFNECKGLVRPWSPTRGG